MSKVEKSLARSKVRKANRQEFPLIGVESIDIFNDPSFIFECRPFRELDRDAFDWAFELLSTNMRNFYEQSSWGWNVKKKKAELKSPKAWCLFAKERSNLDNFAGFVHFRYDLDYGLPVLYLYEIHVEEAQRRKGLGRRSLGILRILAHRVAMEKIIATVFKTNQESLDFFRANGFREDETNPAEDENVDYVILSLKL